MVAQRSQHPAISIVMPAYNAAATLDAALASLAAQDFPAFELILVDDGSSDATPDIARRWCECDARFVLLSQAHASAGVARNLGLSQARGDYLLFLDADDVFDPALLSYLYAAATETGAEVTMCAADCFVDDPAQPVRIWGAGKGELAMGVYAAPQLDERLFQCTTTVLWNKLFASDLVERAGVVFQDLPRFNDAYFTIMMLAHAHTFCKIDNVLVHYRVAAGGSLVDREAEQPYCDIAALDEARTQLEAAGLLVRLKRTFDNLCINTITWRLAHFARVNEAATAELYDAYFGTYEDLWGLAQARWPYVRSVRYALEYRLMKEAGVRGLVEASASDRRDRTSRRDVCAEGRFILRLHKAVRASRTTKRAHGEA